MYEIIIQEFETSDPVKLTRDDVSLLLKYHSRHVYLQPVSQDTYKITAGSYVGYIVLRDKIISLKPKVPNDNLLFIISCILDRIDFVEQINLTANPKDSLLDILVLVLLVWVKRLIKKGLYKNYIKHEDYIPGLKGKVVLSKNIYYIDKLFCLFDELSHSLYENIVIKSTIHHILTLNISESLKDDAKILIKMLSEIKSESISSGLFSKINYSRLNYHYKKIIDLCYIIYSNTSIKQEFGASAFMSFMIDMNIIFEEFVRRYIQINLPEYIVRKKKIASWAHGLRSEYIPVMEPDIVIENKLVIDAKYYKNILTKRGSLNSSNLYQILAYMDVTQLDGLLIYPLNDIEFGDTYLLNNGPTFSIKTLDMSGSLMRFRESLGDMISFITKLLI